jgi:hypothetical protein
VKNPLDFFFQYCLGIRPPAEISTIVSNQLDAKDRGSWLHSSLEKLVALYLRSQPSGNKAKVVDLTALFKRGLATLSRDVIEKQSALAWSELMPQVQAEFPDKYGFFAEGSPEDWLRDYSELQNTFQTQVTILERWRDSFLVEQSYSEFRPHGLEVYLGSDNSDNSKHSVIEMNLFCNQPYSIKVKGRIDRVDRNQREQVRVVDYKSGHILSAFVPFISSEHYVDGRKFQLGWYAFLVEQGLQFPVVRAEYQFFGDDKVPKLFSLDAAQSQADQTIAVGYATLIAQSIEKGYFPYKMSTFASDFTNLFLPKVTEVRARFARALRPQFGAALQGCELTFPKDAAKALVELYSTPLDRSASNRQKMLDEFVDIWATSDGARLEKFFKSHFTRSTQERSL